MVPVSRHLNVVRESDETYMLRVAFSTSDGKTVNQHFGYAKSIQIYGVTMDSADLLSVAEFCDDAEQGDDKLQSRISYLDGCAAVYSYACGASAVRRLISTGIQPIRVTEEAPVHELIKALQKEIKQGPGSWLAKAIEREKRLLGNTFSPMDSNSWEE